MNIKFQAKVTAQCGCTHICNPTSIWETETGLPLSSHPGLHGEIQATKRDLFKDTETRASEED